MQCGLPQRQHILWTADLHRPRKNKGWGPGHTPEVPQRLLDSQLAQQHRLQRLQQLLGTRAARAVRRDAARAHERAQLPHQQPPQPLLRAQQRGPCQRMRMKPCPLSRLPQAAGLVVPASLAPAGHSLCTPLRGSLATLGLIPAVLAVQQRMPAWPMLPVLGAQKRAGS